MKSTPNLPFKASTELKGSLITFRIPQSLTEALNTRSKDLNASRSAYIQRAIEKAIEGEGI
jgi:predicted DNA-binding protein